jgi:hypothetical protein
MESLRSMIELVPPRTPSDATSMTEDKVKGLYLSLRFLATLAVKAFCHIDKKFPSFVIWNSCNRYSIIQIS